MCVNKKQMHYGAVLAKICGSSEAVRLIERSKDDREIYQVDGLARCQEPIYFYLKYSASPREVRRTGGHSWAFSFSEAHIQRLRELLDRQGTTYVALVCGRKSFECNEPPIQICLISDVELRKLLDLTMSCPGSIRVEYQRGKQLRVFGSRKIAEPLLVPANRLDDMTSSDSAA